MRPSFFGTCLTLAACTGGEGVLRFDDRTAALGLSFTHTSPPDLLPYGTGAAWLDCDGDGDEDLWVTRRAGPSALFRNDGETFTEMGDEAGIADADAAKAGVAVADVDGDGDLDVWVGRTGTDAIYLGDGDCTFTAVADSGLAEGGATQSGAFGDLDGDGIVDLVTTDHTAVSLPAPEVEDARRTRVYRGDGTGRFEEHEAIEHFAVQGAGFAVGLVDLDDDVDLDLVVVHDAFPGLPGNQAFRNVSEPGEIAFEDVGQALGLDVSLSGMGLGIGDLDRDGRVDLAVSNIGRMALMHQGADGRFADRAAELGAGKDRHLDDAFTTWGIAFGDFDNDGWQDLISAGGGLTGFSRYDAQPNGLWRNDAGQFVDVAEGSGAELAEESGRTLALADADGDGGLDAWIVHYGGSGRLLASEPPNHHWLQLALRGTAPNTAAIGARIRVETEDGEQSHWVHSGSSLGAGHSLIAHFGLGDHDTAEVEVRWPDGATDRWSLDADQRHVLEPGSR